MNQAVNFFAQNVQNLNAKKLQNQNVIDSIQDSSAMSEESAATSDELAEQAKRLNSMVGRFQLN